MNAYGNIRKRTGPLAHPRVYSWLRGVVVAVLGLAAVTVAQAQQYSLQSTSASGSASGSFYERNARVVITGSGDYQYEYAPNAWTSLSGFQGLPRIQTPMIWSGLNSSSGPRQVTNSRVVGTMRVRKGGATPGAPRTLQFEIPSMDSQVTYGGSSTEIRQLPEVIFTINAATDALVTTDPFVPYVPGHKEGEARLLLNNNTGKDQTIDWNGQKLLLKPGMNEFRYNGTVDDQGRPTDMPPNFQGQYFGGSGGAPSYLYGNLQTSATGVIEGGGLVAGTKWDTTGATPQVLGVGDGKTRGNTILIPGAGGVGGSVTTLPVTKPAQTGSTTVNGAGGGGTSSVSDPSKPTPTPTGGGGGGTTNITNSVTSNTTNIINNTTEGDNGPPPVDGTGDLSNSGKEAGDAADAFMADVNAGTAKAEGFGKWKWWSGPQALDSVDSSWLTFQIPLAVRTVTITIEPTWISLIRGCLLWIIKIGFVIAILKLVMR